MENSHKYPLAGGHALLEVCADHVRVVEAGDPASAEEMTRYLEAIERFLRAAGRAALLVVAQKAAAPPSDAKPHAPSTPLSPEWKAIREARWRGLARSSAKRIAVIVDDPLALTRVQMAALAVRAPVRAFLSEEEAVAWFSAP